MKKVLVIHPEDVSTDRLQVVYSGKGYEQIRSHDKIIMLGHGTPDGLLTTDRKNILILQ